jgi:hypothetical protein
VSSNDVKTAPGTEGVWRIKSNHGPHRDVLAFKPASQSEAIAFLRQASFQLPSKLFKLCEETPVHLAQISGRVGKKI